MKTALLKLLAIIVFYTVGVANAQELEFHFIDVKQGDCTLIVCPNGFTVLVDCGQRPSDQTISDRTRDYLINHLPGLPTLDVVLITHPDSDHYSFLPDVLDGIQVGRLLHVGEANEHSANNADDWVDQQNVTRLRVNDIDAVETPSDFFESGEVEFHILAADVRAHNSAKNAKSIVLRVDLGNFEAILTGDATFDTEAAVAENYDSEFLDVELLKIGHHGSSATSTSDEWIQLLRPTAAVVSAGFGNSYEHPRKIVMDRVATSAADNAPPHYMRWGEYQNGDTVLRTVPEYTESVFSTATNGNVVVKTDGSEFSINYGGNGQNSGEMELPAQPAESLLVAPVFRTYELTSLSEGGAFPTPERIAEVMRTREFDPLPFIDQPNIRINPEINRMVEDAQLTKRSYEVGPPPIERGTSVEVKTSAGTVRGTFLRYSEGWAVIEDESGATIFVNGSSSIFRLLNEE